MYCTRTRPPQEKREEERKKNNFWKENRVGEIIDLKLKKRCRSLSKAKGSLNFVGWNLLFRQDPLAGGRDKIPLFVDFPFDFVIYLYYKVQKIWTITKCFLVFLKTPVTYPRSGKGMLAGAASPRIRSRASAYSASFYIP